MEVWVPVNNRIGKKCWHWRSAKVAPPCGSSKNTFGNSLCPPVPDEYFGLGLNCIWGKLHCLNFVHKVNISVSMLHCLKSSTQMPVNCVCPSSQLSDSEGGRCWDYTGVICSQLEQSLLLLQLLFPFQVCSPLPSLCAVIRQAAFLPKWKQ